MILDPDGLSSRATCFERLEDVHPPVAVVKRPKVREIVEPVREVRPPAPVECSVTGTWTLRRNGREERSTRFTFSDNGTFRFTGMNAESRGRYVVDGNCVELIWTHIDGEPVRDQDVRKRLPLDGDGFFVDDYRYERQR